ncbi:MAG: MarR family transcriptional regulator [Streptosporangiaceae bacterium]
MATSQRSVVDLTFLLQQAAHVLNTELTAGLAELGVIPRAHCVLANAVDAGLTQIQLAELCQLDKTTMVVTLDALERDGLAERHASPTDRRARIVVVTEAGREVVSRGVAVVDRIHGDVLGSLPTELRVAFVAALEGLTAGRLATPAACVRPVRRRAHR